MIDIIPKDLFVAAVWLIALTALHDKILFFVGARFTRALFCFHKRITASFTRVHIHHKGQPQGITKGNHKGLPLRQPFNNLDLKNYFLQD